MNVQPLLHAISQVIGMTETVDSLVAQGADPDVVAALKARNVTGFSRLDAPLEQGVRTCIVRTLQRAGLQPDQVDTIVLLTESFEGPAGTDATSYRQARESMFDLVESLGLTRTSLMCLNHAGCANLLHGLVTASALVRQGISRHVLLVAAERYPHALQRIARDRASIAGDGVAACVVGASAPPGSLSMAIDFVNLMPYDRSQAGKDQAAVLLETYRAMKRAAADCYDACRRQPADYRWALLGDYNHDHTLVHARLLGFAPERTWIRNLGVRGHIPFDPLLNLGELADEGSLRPGEAALVFLGGPLNCGVVSLSAR